MSNANKELQVFSNNLKRHMNNHQLSRLDVANIVGVSQQSVSNWLNCKFEPNMGAIQKLADYFGVPKSDLLEDKEIHLNEVDFAVYGKEAADLTEKELEEVADFVRYIKSKRK